MQICQWSNEKGNRENDFGLPTLKTQETEDEEEHSEYTNSPSPKKQTNKASRTTNQKEKTNQVGHFLSLFSSAVKKTKQLATRCDGSEMNLTFDVCSKNKRKKIDPDV